MWPNWRSGEASLTQGGRMTTDSGRAFLDEVKLAKDPGIGLIALEEARETFWSFNRDQNRRFCVVFLWPLYDGVVRVQGMLRTLDFALIYGEGMNPIPFRYLEIGLGWQYSTEELEITETELAERLKQAFGDRFAGFVQGSAEFWRKAELQIEASKDPTHERR